MDQAAANRAREAIGRVGHVVSFRRMSRSTPQTEEARADVKATVKGYAPSELVNGVTAGMRQVIVSKLDLQAKAFPLPLKKGDQIWLGDALEILTTIDAIDVDHREYQGCFEINTKGN